MSVTTDELMPDEGHPEPDFPAGEDTPVELWRQITEEVVVNLRWLASSVHLTPSAVQSQADALERAMYLAAGGAE